MLTLKADWEKIMEKRDWLSIQNDIRSRGAQHETSPVTRRLLNHMQPLPRSLKNLVDLFTKAIEPAVTSYNVVWGLLSLNIKVGGASRTRILLMAASSHVSPMTSSLALRIG